MRRKLLVGIFTPVLFVALTGSAALAQNKIGLNGLGGRVSLVKPENLGATVGLGAHADLGSLNHETIFLVPSIEYWSKDNVSEFAINGDARYHLPSAPQSNLTFFVGGGLALVFTDFDSEFVNGRTDLGIEILGGLEAPVSPSVNGFVEGKLKFDGFDTFKINAGITVRIAR